ncbi:hypothetical protein QQS21_009708 [Conoideocrella luteorostrata]|uniref:FAD-binding PCMH-type domain-containing protein n=1 Tax=Conoideocrella luteorostrata TaxID=1105319 RepID=A0AAJ0FQ32_9HYPO|nr:hypothetical protein QQS21_009708 [Conoideocrella luteorostrata]
MATIESLKWSLRQEATETTSSQTHSLSDEQYRIGFDTLMQGLERTTYEHFIIPQLSSLLVPLFNSRTSVSVLEIGPGPKSVLEYLPGSLRRKISRYAAFEPNKVFATMMEERLCSTSDTEAFLPCLKHLPDIYQIPFAPDNSNPSIGSNGASKFDVVLFCHSMYGMKPKRRFIERALTMLPEQPQDGIVAVFHRDKTLCLDGLVCHRTASFPIGMVSVADDDAVLDSFAPFVAGFVMQDVDAGIAVGSGWRKVCRALGRRDNVHPGHLLFSSPNMMMALTRHAASLSELTAQVPLVSWGNRVKNRECRSIHPASIMRPTDIGQLQECVYWALDHQVGLTVVGGGHSGHCLQPNVVSLDMSAFDQVDILAAEEKERPGSGSGPLVLAGAGCKSGDIISKAMAAGLTVPLGSRPSVGAGLWLQGGIGHLARMYGLACDSIVGAIVVSVSSGEALCVGYVPSQHLPAGVVHPENGDDLLWALKGAGTNFGVVVSVTFNAYAAATYSIRNWVIPLNDNWEAQRRLADFDDLVATKLPRNCSADAYLYWDSGRLRLGVTMFESSTSTLACEAPTPISAPARRILGPENSIRIVDGVGLFDTEMYMSEMHGGHGGGKTSSFKRCIFLKGIGAERAAHILVAAVETRPLPFCYIHLLHGGGAVADVAEGATAFGCRDWDFACVITGVWPRDQDGTPVARAAVQWVYNVALALLPLSNGAYGADLGPDPRDAALAVTAFGPNRPRLARLKHRLDPGNVLAYACPLPKVLTEQKLIILVTGDFGAGKDYCAATWASMLGHSTYNHRSLRARAVSISDVAKKEYAAATGADLDRLLRDRAYKEQHRPALTAWFQAQVQRRPQLPTEHFLGVVSCNAYDVDVLFVTGMRDEAPVTAFSHLVPNSRLLEVRVRASKVTRQFRRGREGSHDVDKDNNKDTRSSNSPCLVFNNETEGNDAVRGFLERHLLPFFHEDLQRLTSMVRPTLDFPRQGIEFRHVLDIAQQPGGLALCTALLQSHFRGDWAKVDAMACCEAGGFIYASALAARVDVPLALIREAGKLPPPTISVAKSSSYISQPAASGVPSEKRIEMARDAVSSGASVVVVDDVLSTGETLCAVLQLLEGAGVGAELVSVMVVAEFSVHCGRELLRQRGFGRANIQSLMVFDGV